MELNNLSSKFSIQLSPVYELDSITSCSFLKLNYKNDKHYKKNQRLTKDSKIQQTINFQNNGVLSSHSKKEITIIRTQPLNLYIIQKNTLKFILKFDSMPAIAKINYDNLAVNKSKLKPKDKETVLEFYVLTKQGKLWQIFLNMDEEAINFKKNTLKDEDGKVIKKKKSIKTNEAFQNQLSNLYPIMINITSKIKNNKIINNYENFFLEKNSIPDYSKIYSFNLLYHSNNMYNFYLHEKYLMLYSYNNPIQYIDIISKKISSEKIKNISEENNITYNNIYIKPLTVYSTNIASIGNEIIFLTIHKSENEGDNLFINENNYYISPVLFRNLFHTESNQVDLIGTIDGEVYWIDNPLNNKPKLLINIEEPIYAFHILNLKNNSSQRKKPLSSNDSIYLKSSPKKLNNNILMVIGKYGSVVLYRIIERDNSSFIIKKKYHITSPLFSSCIINNYLFITSKYYDGSRKITYYNLFNDEKEEEFRDILIPKIFPCTDDIHYFNCFSHFNNNVIYQQLHLNGLWTTGVFDLSSLNDNSENTVKTEITNPSKIIMPILEDINKLSMSIDEYKKDHKILNRSIMCMNEAIFFLITFIDYINRNEYNELPISCEMIMKYYPESSYYTITIALKFKISITNNWMVNMSINPYIEEMDSKATVYNVALPNLKKDELWYYTFNYKNRYQSFPIDISLRLCLSIPESGDVVIPFYIKKYDNLDFIYPLEEVTKSYVTENTNPLIEESYFNNKQELLSEIRHIFNSSSNDTFLIDSKIQHQRDIYIILVDCNKENSNLFEIKNKFLFLTLISSNLVKSDFEKIAKRENEVIFKIPSSSKPIKIISQEIKLENITPNIQALKFSIFGEDLSAILSVRQCLLDRIHTISNNIQVNQFLLKSNDILKSKNNMTMDVIYEIKKAIILTLDTIILSQKKKQDKANDMNVFYNKINQTSTQTSKLITFKYIKKELQNLYKKFEDLMEIDNVGTIMDSNSKIMIFNDHLMELNGLLQTLDSIHMEICFMDRSYLFYI
ncbi:hypothetical protein BCR32DRAFT_265578 [Anaeromyces robustus]|uniref:Uncharacterized protein n=1 Tax=Anaeromyces robustus TaxID=1754192 RepID=A0A1Y1XID3_9FUNG|nr:hypothetical protein BCR32DRAFT_265578 [Anaeromyces robustus]|eukprot:ORX85519.1 hypothetical protein BCR32DRAFT_265578 [Anaeromyces robustus]